MNMEEYVASLANLCADETKLKELRKGLPLGRDVVENIVLAQKRERPLTVRHTCVTGGQRSNFICRMLLTISRLYTREEACFLIISPKTEYGELMRANAMDVAVPYIFTKEDLALAVATVKELLSQRQTGRGYPRLFLVLDGLERIDGCNVNGDLEEYREIFDLFKRNADVDVITGVDLMKSIFSGYPGAFVGVGNCLVSLREEGKADVTYVNEEGGLSLPTPISYPAQPSITETVIFLNSLSKAEPKAE
ncbi:MAG: hypothetical protein E7352_07005 [Clostridiales bacterium]|nr:hypothetical protein [Clostridiales bacterium]